MGPLGHACHRIWDLGGGGGGSKIYFSEHGHVAYQRGRAVNQDTLKIFTLGSNW